MTLTDPPPSSDRIHSHLDENRNMLQKPLFLQETNMESPSVRLESNSLLEYLLCI